MKQDTKWQRKRGKKEGWVIHGLGSQFFIASSDLPSQEYFLALPKALPLAHDPTGSPCIRDTGVEQRDYVEGKKEQSVATPDKLRCKRRHMSPSCSFPLFLLLFSAHTSAEIRFSRYMFLYFFPLAFFYLASSRSVVSFFFKDLYHTHTHTHTHSSHLLLHYSLIVNLQIIHITKSHFLCLEWIMVHFYNVLSLLLNHKLRPSATDFLRIFEIL